MVSQKKTRSLRKKITRAPIHFPVSRCGTRRKHIDCTPEQLSQKDINSPSFKQRSVFFPPSSDTALLASQRYCFCTDTWRIHATTQLYKRFFMNQNLYLRIKSEILFMFRWVWTRVLPFLMSSARFLWRAFKKHFVSLKHQITDVNERWLPLLLQYLRIICRVMSRHYGTFNWKPLAAFVLAPVSRGNCVRWHYFGGCSTRKSLIIPF